METYRGTPGMGGTMRFYHEIEPILCFFCVIGDFSRDLASFVFFLHFSMKNYCFFCDFPSILAYFAFFSHFTMVNYIHSSLFIVKNRKLGKNSRNTRKKWGLQPIFNCILPHNHSSPSEILPNIHSNNPIIVSFQLFPQIRDSLLCHVSHGSISCSPFALQAWQNNWCHGHSIA